MSPAAKLSSDLFLTLVGLVTLAICGACEHPPTPATSWQSSAVQRPPPALALRQSELASQMIADLYAGLAVLEGGSAAAMLLLAGAATLDDAALRDDAGARRLVVSAIYFTVHSRGLGTGFKQVRTLVDRMYALAPEAPETRFALAYLRWILLSDGKGGLRMADMEAQVAQGLLKQLDILTRDHPQFDGPGDFDRQRLVVERDAVRALLNKLPARGETTGAGLPADATAAMAP